MNLLKYPQIQYRLNHTPGRRGNAGFSLLEVLVATALMGLMLVVLLQILSTVFRTEEGIWRSTRALLLAEKVIHKHSELSTPTAGVFQGREEDLNYRVNITPQYEVSSPQGELHLTCFLMQVTVSWTGWNRKKMLILETVRTVPGKKL